MQGVSWQRQEGPSVARLWIANCSSEAQVKLKVRLLVAMAKAQEPLECTQPPRFIESRLHPPSEKST